MDSELDSHNTNKKKELLKAQYYGGNTLSGVLSSKCISSTFSVSFVLPVLLNKDGVLPECRLDVI